MGKVIKETRNLRSQIKAPLKRRRDPTKSQAKARLDLIRSR